MKDSEQTLLDIYRKLNEHDAHALMRYAQFLVGYETTTASLTNDMPSPKTENTAASTPKIEEPVKIARPEQERVVEALKRLSASYPMLEKKNLLDKASELVAQHVMFGKPARTVIDEIELLFARAYDDYRTKAGTR